MFAATLCNHKGNQPEDRDYTKQWRARGIMETQLWGLMKLNMVPSLYLNFSTAWAFIAFINSANLSSSLLFIIKTVLIAKIFRGISIWAIICKTGWNWILKEWKETFQAEGINTKESGEFLFKIYWSLTIIKIKWIEHESDSWGKGFRENECLAK